jgi:hypothetical protein
LWSLDAKYYLTNDIILEGTNNHTPIGNDANPFIGTFNGNGFAVRGMNIDIEAPGNMCLGLFGCLSGNAEILDLGIEEVFISHQSSLFATSFAGGVAGHVKYDSSGVTISGCYTTGYLKSSSTDCSYVGGIIGGAEGPVTITDSYNAGYILSLGLGPCSGGIAGMVSNDANISDCYNTGTVIAYPALGGSAYVGGITAYSWGGSLTISDCYNTGELMTPEKSYGEFVRVGGIVGLKTGSMTIERSYNAGELSGHSLYYKGTVVVGGIIGQVGSGAITVDECHNTGSLTVSSRLNSVAGGIAAFVAGSLTVKASYNTGAMEATGGSETQIYAFAGGAVGYMAAGSSADVITSYNTGGITASAHTSAYAGGTFGYVGGGSATVSVSYNTGAMEATGRAETSYAYAGGAVAYVGSGSATVTDYYNTASVTAAAPYATYAGGVAGYTGTGSVTAANCYSVGTVSASSEYAYAGGIIGRQHADGTATINSCYYLTGEVWKNGSQEDKLLGTGTAAVDGNDDGTPMEGIQGTGAKTEDELRSALAAALSGDSIYFIGTGDGDAAGWDFNSVWTIIKDENNGFPVLQFFFGAGGDEGNEGGDEKDDEDVTIIANDPSYEWLALLISALMLFTLVLAGYLFFIGKKRDEEEEEQK